MKSVLLIVAVAIAVMVIPATWAQESAPAPAVPEKPAEVIRFINDFSAPPFASKEGLTKVGFEVDLGEALGKELGRKVEWVQINFNPSAFAAALQGKTADAVMSSMSSTTEREKQFAFTRPYYRTDLAAAARKDADWNHLNFKNGLQNQKVGVLRRTTGEAWARKNLKATRVTYDTPPRLARALNNNDVYAIILDLGILEGVLTPQAYKFKVVEKGLDSEDYCIAVSPDNQQLLNDLNAALEKLDASNVYDEIYNKWFGHKSDLPPTRRLKGTE